MRLFLTLFIVCCWPQKGWGQQDTVVKKSQKGMNKINSSAYELKKSLDANDQAGIARNYEKLAQDFLEKNDLAKAENYLKKALASYTTLKKEEDKARVSRSLAKVQEAQNKFKEAVSNYRAASESSKDIQFEQINTNDANRLKIEDKKAEADYLNANIELLKNTDKKEEVADAYVQKARSSIKSNNQDDAIENYKQAIAYTGGKPEKMIRLQNEIAQVYVSGRHFDQAAAIHEQLLAQARKKKDFNTQIDQLQALGDIYFKNGQDLKAVTNLKEAYRIAATKGNTAAVKKSLNALQSYFKKTGETEQGLALYQDFLGRLDQVIASDTSLINNRILQDTEEKIQQLEKEKRLKDELINRKNIFNYLLISGILLLAILFGLIARALFSIKRKNKEIALQSLRREMNPHFIFNSLNSVNQFISQNNELEANKFLTSYSKLMRHMMEHSNKDFVPLGNEIGQLTKYLDLEHLRFRDKFDYTIWVDPRLDTEAVLVPNMLIQPHLENAIWHGLRYLDAKGSLELRFECQRDWVVVHIADNGIGLAKSASLKTDNQKTHQSRGLTNTRERIALLNVLYRQDIRFTIKEKNNDGQTGTVVTLEFPLIYKI